MYMYAGVLYDCSENRVRGRAHRLYTVCMCTDECILFQLQSWVFYTDLIRGVISMNHQGRGNSRKPEMFLGDSL